MVVLIGEHQTNQPGAGAPQDTDSGVPLWALPLRPLVDLVAVIRASVHAKLLTGFLAGALLLLAMGALSLVVINRMNQQVTELERLQENTNRAQRMVYLVTAQSHFRAMELLTNADFYNDSIILAKEEFEENLDRVETNSTSAKTEFFAKIREDQASFKLTSAEVQAAYEAGALEGATEIHLTQEHEVSHDLESAMWLLIEDTKKEMTEATAAFRSDSRFLANTVWGFSGASIIAALLLGFVVSWAFVRPVRRIDQAVAAIADGDFTQRVTVPNRDEFGALCSNVNTMSEQLGSLYAQAEELGALQERNRLARDLHDSVTQTIFGMTLVTEAARVQLERDPTAVGPRLERLQEMAQEALDDMRSLIQQLRPSQLSGGGLVSALLQHVESLEKEGGLNIDLHIEGQERLTTEVADGLFRIVQEALNNVSKHANTDRAKISLLMDEGRVSLEVEDQGSGFDSSMELSSSGGFGLTSMRERAELLGSRLEVRSTPGQGTRVLLELTPSLGGQIDGKD